MGRNGFLVLSLMLISCWGVSSPAQTRKQVSRKPAQSATPAANSQSQQATITNEALIYQNDDFDAPVIATLKRGTVYTISKGKKGPFYKIRVKPGTVGWIADTDVKVGVHKVATPKAQKEMKPLFDPEKENDKKKKPFFASRFRGFTLDYIYYTEDTIGGTQSEFMMFYGAKFYGFNTLFDGEIYTESNILFSPSAPKYYEDVTGKSAGGFIFITDFLFQTPTPRGKDVITFYGFGPMLKYSHFNLEVPDGNRTLNYAADDMTIGAVINLGFAARFNRVAVRFDAKYYWEKTQYYGLGANVGLDF